MNVSCIVYHPCTESNFFAIEKIVIFSTFTFAPQNIVLGGKVVISDVLFSTCCYFLCGLMKVNTSFFLILQFDLFT